MPVPSSLITRLAQALKGVGRFANPKARVVVQQVTTRDCLVATGVDTLQSITARSTPPEGLSALSITDGAGNLYVMLNVLGAAEGATLR